MAYWARRFGRDGLAGPREEERPGRPQGPGAEQVQGIDATLRRQPEDFGLTGSLWDGKTQSECVKRQWDASLGIRQDQRLIRQLGFRLIKPRPVIAKASAGEQARVSKTPPTGKKRTHRPFGDG